MPLSPEQEALCERVEKGEPEPRAAVLIRKQAHEMTTSGTDSVAPMRSFAVSSPGAMIREEMEALPVMLEGSDEEVSPLAHPNRYRTNGPR